MIVNNIKSLSVTQLQMPSAYLLISHGSRDPRPQVAMEQLARLISQRQTGGEISRTVAASHEASDWVQTAAYEPELNTYNRPWQSSATGSLTAPPMWEPVVGTACLELSPVPLHEQIIEFSDRVASECNHLKVVPLFLLPGVHVMEDIPGEVALARAAIGQDITIELQPHLGTHPGISSLLATQMAAIKADAWIVLAHGSRRAGSKQPVEAIATQLRSHAGLGHTSVVEAYWAVSPRLESRVKELVSAGDHHIGILPYFLFAGGITDAIAQAVEELKVQFPNALLHLAAPLGASAELADLIWDLIGK